MTIQRLFPDPSGPTDVTVAYGSPTGSHPDRPWVGLSMVASIDGSTAVGRTSNTLSGTTDQLVYQQLRSIADVVLVGAGTARLEGYGPPSQPGQRIGVVTRRGTVDTSTDLFTSGSGFVITTMKTHVEARGTDVIRAGTAEVNLQLALDTVAEICPIAGFVLVEGGPTLNAAFIDADLFDEINVTTSPLTVSGNGPRLAMGGVDQSRRFELAHLGLDDESFMFARWRRCGTGLSEIAATDRDAS